MKHGTSSTTFYLAKVAKERLSTWSSRQFVPPGQGHIREVLTVRSSPGGGPAGPPALLGTSAWPRGKTLTVHSQAHTRPDVTPNGRAVAPGQGHIPEVAIISRQTLKDT